MVDVPFGCVGVGDSALQTVVNEGEGLFRDEDTLEVGRIELELHVLRVRCGREIEPIEPFYILRYAAAVVTHEGSECSFGLRESNFDNRSHGRGHVGRVHRDFPLRVGCIARINIGVLLFASRQAEQEENSDNERTSNGFVRVFYL